MLLTASKRENQLSGRLGEAVESLITASAVWGFGLMSCAMMLFLGSILWVGDTLQASPLLLSNVGFEGRPYGLTFEGRTGAYLAGAQAAGVLAALGMSLLASPGLRRLGLSAMVVWTGLWAFNGVMLCWSLRNGWFPSDLRVVAMALALLLVFGCSIHRAHRLWKLGLTL